MSVSSTRSFLVATTILVLASGSAFGQSLVGRNSNAVGPTPEGFYRGLPHYQDNEPHCDRNPLLDSNIICMGNGYAGADDVAVGDAWPRIFETQDNARTWVSRFATGSGADSVSDLGLGFGADPIMVCWPGGCGGFFIAANRAALGGTGGGVYMQLLPEINIETGFRHFSEVGPRTVQLASGNTFLDKIDAIFLIDTDNPGTIEVETTVDRGNGIVEIITREWPRGRLLVVFAAINSSEQNIRIYSTFSDDFGLNWSPPKQVANTTGVDTGVAVAAIDDTILYAYRQFRDDSGGQLDSVFAAISTTKGQTIRKPFTVVDDMCAFDQPTLPNAGESGFVASRTNNFVDVSSDGDNFVMVLAGRLRNPADGSCLTEPFDYQAGSRVLVTTAGPSGKGWSTPEEIATPPDDAHSFQFMPAVDCVLGVCQVIWYDSFKDSLRNLNYLNSTGRSDVVDVFKNLPLFADFVYPRSLGNDEFEYLQFRRTVDVMTRQFVVDKGNIIFRDEAPVQVSQYQLALFGNEVREVEQIPFHLKQYKGNTASFMGDYIGLASSKVRGHPNPADPLGAPIYESNNGVDQLNPLLKPSWFAFWTDTRNAHGQLYTENIEEAVPFEKTGSSGMFVHEGNAPDIKEEPALLSAERKLSAEGLEDSNSGAFFCAPPMDPPDAAGDILYAVDNQNRIKDADIYGALIEVPVTAWVLNANKGLGLIQRSYVIAARNERATGTKFLFRIMNQPVGFPDVARASWEQLPFADFDVTDTPLLETDEEVGPQSSVTVALFVVSDEAVNPVTVNIYEVDADNNEEFLETLIVNGTLEAGDLVNSDFQLNLLETHNPIVFAPNTYGDIDFSNPDVWNPDVWNPDVWNPDVWNPDVWNPDVWNPDVWNPDVWNPDVWNPDVWNPDVWNVGLTDADDLDNAEIPSPELGDLPRAEDGTIAKFDVQFNALNDGNTTTPYTADFEAASPIVRDLLASGDVKVQIIVSQDAKIDSFQGCDPDVTGENRILAVANNPDMLDLEIPDIFNNRIGSVTYYSVPGDRVQITARFMGTPATIRIIAPELVDNGVSYVVTSQVANTGQFDLDSGRELAIQDFTPPNLSVGSGGTVVVQAMSPQGAILPDDFVTASKGEFETPPVSCSPINIGELAPLGDSDLICSATAENDVTASADVTASVQDLDPPELDLMTMPNDLPLQRETIDGAVALYTLPTVSDLIDVNVTAECTPIAPGEQALFTAPGPTETEITCRAVDAAGTSIPASFLITVEDTTPPVLTIPASAGAEAMSVMGAYVDFLPLPSASDIGTATVACNLFDDPTAPVESGDRFPPGETKVACTATDDANLPTTGDFVVTVADTIPPVFTMTVADFAIEANTIMSSVGGAFTDFEQPTAMDLDEPIGVNCDFVPDGDFYPLLPTPTTVTCTTIPDGGNRTASTSFKVTVIDTTPPVLTVPSDMTVTYGASVTFNATATDLGEPIQVTCDPVSGSAFSTIGTTTVGCTATDASGNLATDSFTVTTTLSAGSGMTSNKKTVKAGSVAGFNWIWEDDAGNPFDVGEGNQDIEARLGTCSNPQSGDILDEDPGTSSIRRSGDGWTFNWQTVNGDLDPIPEGDYCVTAVLMTTNPQQTQSTGIKVRQ